MKRIFPFFILLGFFVVPGIVCSQELEHELFLGGPGSFLADVSGLSGSTGAGVSLSDDVKAIGFNAGYGYPLGKNFELIATSGFLWVRSGGNSAALWSLLLGPRLNFGSDTALNSFYLGASAGGLVVDSDPGSEWEMVLGFDLGKRFQIGNSPLSYTPEINLMKVMGSDMVVAIIPVAFSFFF